MAQLEILPPELWLEVFEWATYNPFLNVHQSHSPFQPVPFRDNIRDSNLDVKLTISLVCRQWRLWMMRLLYSDIKIKDHKSASDLRKALERTTPTPGGYYGEMVRRVVLSYNSTAPGPSNQPMPSVEILKLCPYIHTLLRPCFSPASGLYFDREAVGVALPALQRLEWCYYGPAERSGGINSLGAVLHAAPNISYLFVGGGIGSIRHWTQKGTLPRLQTLRLGVINGLLLHQIVSCWSLPSLTYLVLDSPLKNAGFELIWHAFGRQIRTVEFGKHLRFYADDHLSPCLNGCPGLEELNFYFYFTKPAENIQPHTSLNTVRLHAAVNLFVPDNDTVWNLIDRHFELLCGSYLPALRRIILYGDSWQSVLRHPRFISIRNKLQDVDRVLELSH